ncbi:uncharacterized protein EV420DRAFT_1645958 [Desarmillaria tabescens]|uniref:Uncharacterized protein n=1 Tax=Armillaria tabescens TaxID=1929756 RepID=A0AA39K0G2_ARMTA|nr:uncharacterized protein EV420DRAFT_1645958 [Desarmillaria tabescens]KAK0452007.1 hypothetical protein EV420DRAFT_1645958 [Desarmillaria tabescens]
MERPTNCEFPHLCTNTNSSHAVLSIPPTQTYPTLHARAADLHDSSNLPTPDSTRLAGPQSVHPSTPPISSSAYTSHNESLHSHTTSLSTQSASVSEINNPINILESCIALLPENFPVAAPSDILAAFSGDPALYDDPTIASADLWEKILNRKMHVFLGKSELELAPLVRVGENGISGFCRFVRYFVEQRGVNPMLFDSRVRGFTAAIQSILARHKPLSFAGASKPGEQALSMQSPPGNLVVGNAMGSHTSYSQQLPVPTNEIIDVDTLIEPSARATVISVPSRYCQGYLPTFPPDKSPHMLYPFALHDELSLPWDYESRNGILRLHAQTCQYQLDDSNGMESCLSCIKLGQEPILKGIELCAVEGTHENTTLSYRGFGELTKKFHQKNKQINNMRLKHLNMKRKLLSCTRELDNYKQLILQIGHGNFTNAEKLIRIALKNKKGIKRILDLYKAASQGVYHPKSFTEEEEMLAILIWRLGGIHLAEIAHRALGLPSMTTIQHHSTVPSIIPSYGQPSLTEIEKNIAACFESILSVLQSLPAGVLQVILMFDEIAVEKRPRWDYSTNMIMGLCRKHSHNVDLEFKTSESMDEVFNAIDNNEVHYASEATVGALSILSNDKRLYAARPILVSGTCKKENALEHAYILKTVLTAINHQQTINMLHLVSIASDGETKRGGALALLTCKKELALNSPIYEYLSPCTLRFMNFLVGDNDITADKDYKHVFKRLRNLFIRLCGVSILDVHITPTMIQSHLRSEGHSEAHIHELFKPNDKQNVELAYKLLKDIWSLPEVSSEKPGFAHA